MEKMRIKVNGKTYDVEVEFLNGDGAVRTKSENAPKTAPVSNKATVKNTSGNGIKAPIAGVVKEIKVKKGENIEENQLVAVLEAMKMNTNVMADISGVVSDIPVNPGDSVKQGQLLIKF